MKRLAMILFVIGWMFITSGIAQSSSGELQFSYEIEQKIAEGQMRIPTASYWYTFTGNYPQAIATYDVEVWWGVDTIDVSGYRVEPALGKIVQEARDRRIVIISDRSHLKPQHRIFAKQIIDSLAGYGFNHLGIETLASDLKHEQQLRDSSLNERGYPLFGLSGYYSKEPQMAELIRSAKRNQYTIFGYEEEQTQQNDRDENHADNVIQYLTDTDAEKIILLCGWHHAIESDLLKKGKSYWMAKRLKDRVGTDPLTIYQDNFTEKIVFDEHDLLFSIKGTTPLAFVDHKGQVVRLTDHVDIEVIHPKTRYINGRPHWLYQSDLHKSYAVDKDWIEIDYPVFLMAYNMEEGSASTAVDIIEMKDRFDQKSLILTPGKYLLVVDNKERRQEKEITIE